MKRERGSTRRISAVVLLISTLIIAVSLHGLALGQVLKPGKTPIIGGSKVTEEDKITSSEVGPPDRVSILVHMIPGAPRGLLQNFLAGEGAFVKYSYDLVLPNVINVRNFPTAALKGLLSIPGVEGWQEDRAVHMHLNVSTPLINGLQSQIIGAGLSADGSGVRVCVVDTGIDGDNFMYEDRIDANAGRDFVNNDNDPEDDNGHGSHVAGIVAGNDVVSVFQGIAPGATIIGIKVLDADGTGLESDILAGINYGADQSLSGGKCDVMNMSFGGALSSSTCDNDSIAIAANNAVDQGVVVIASSGNQDIIDGMAAPACGSKVTAVGATYDANYQDSFEFCTLWMASMCWLSCTDNAPTEDQICCFSNEGPQLDVTAPGCITVSADSSDSQSGTVGYCGTSMAAPHVAGLAALLLSVDSSLTPAEVRQHIRDGAIDLGAPGFDWIYGYGRIDVINSLSLAGPQCEVPADCDDGDLCTTDTCVDGNCSNKLIVCNDGDACTTDSCDPASGCYHEPINCDDDDLCTTDSCNPVSGCVNDPITCSEGEICIDGVCVVPAGCGNGVCDWGEDCNNCPRDCISGQGGGTCDTCFKGVCDGKCNPSKDGPDCADCASSYCCGDGICEGNESNLNCAFDCPATICGDGTCDPIEDNNNCPDDCPAQSCGGNKAECSDNSDCCSNVCKNGTCRGN